MTKSKIFTALLAVFLLGAGLPAAAQSKSAGEHVDDTVLHTKVKSTIATRGGAGINIEVYKGEVQLAGFVRDPDLKDSLADRTARVGGVQKVYNQIVVVEPDRSAGEVLDDNVLSAKVNAALAEADFSESFSINTEVNRRAVLLSGFVDSDADRDAAVKTVQGVEGVARVIDGINVKSDG